MSAADNPLRVSDVLAYGATLRTLLRALDREVVDAALFGERESDLLDAEREEVDRFREFLDGRVLVPLVLDGFRGRGLALLDAFGDELRATEHVDCPSLSVPTVAPAVDVDLSVGAASDLPVASLGGSDALSEPCS